ncbi:unnamed protein product [Arabidopsis halleri]
MEVECIFMVHSPADNPNGYELASEHLVDVSFIISAI